ncbi:MAG: leucine--tRNA ligase [Elusimicrobia bacterium]|nr:leucine--tRNA ligase [Elusimicrobiota bacterium]
MPPPEHIPFPEIEAKWQKRWAESGVFKAPERPRAGKKFYCLDMFPYPSADGLHVGHPEGYTATDILCRYRRMKGDDVLHPMGWDAFGLPAENFALQTGTHPRIVTQRNIANFRRQIQALGFSYDWAREVDTTDPAYYRWTQWIFLQLHKKGLTYEGVVPINWCPSCKTGLANEEVFGGACERCGAKVERKNLRQWLLKITAYAERLLADLEGLDWPESTLAMQRNWIGRSEGAYAVFRAEAPGTPAHGAEIQVFTTRPDTLYGATYVVLAPEHPLVPALTLPERRAEVEAYVKAAGGKTDVERSGEDKKKTGVPTGGFALNPVNGRKVPVWIADYVLAGYGTGAIMAVPAHDERDFEFAKAFGLPIEKVVDPPAAEDARALERLERAFTGGGTAVNSPAIDGLATPQAKDTIIAFLESRGAGRRQVTYKLRDWVFSRQRYWGEPIPIVRCGKCGNVPVPEAELPVLLPDVQDYKPTGTGESPLAAIEDWVKTACPTCGGPGRRETNTMPQWAGSCWYYLRFLDAKNGARGWGPEAEKSWMPVDCYVGGSEHAVLHLLYARFWHKVLFDLGVVSTKEPFQKLRHQGMILSYAYRDARGAYHGYGELDIGEGNRATLKASGEAIEPMVEKMSKSKKNVINPDDILARYGADVFRMYEMFMGPFADPKPWDMQGIEGLARFLRRAWSLLAPPWQDREGLVALRHRTTEKVGSDIEGLRFNTALSALMIYLNGIQDDAKAAGAPARPDAEAFLTLLHPFAPHATEEVWERAGQGELLARRPWPAYDARFLKEDQVQLAVQVNGKVRDRLTIESGAAQDRVKAAALTLPKVRSAIDGGTVVNVIVVPDRLVNIVIKK